MYFKSLGIRLSVFVAVILIVSIGIFTFININNYRKQLISEVINRASQLSDIIKRSTMCDMLEHRRERLHKTIETIGQQEDIEKVRVFNKKGKIMFSTDKKEVTTLVDKQAEACYTCHSKEKPLEKLSTAGRTRIFKSKEKNYRILGIINPIYNEKTCYTAPCHAHPKEQKVLGVLDIWIPLSKIDKTISKTRLRMTLFSAITIVLISIVISLFSYRYVNIPIKRLLAGTREIAKAKFDRPIEIHSNDEIGELANSFNKMSRELKKANQSFRLATIGKIAAQVAHEVNNPLTTVLSFSTILLENMEKDDPKREDIETIVEETIRCREIIKGLLNLAKQAKPERKLVNINKIIEKTLPLIEHKISFYNIEITKELNPDIPKTIADERQIQQVFLNLLLNASESMPEGGKLSVKSDITNGERSYISVSFSDTGCGIDEENIDRLFNAFFTTKESGTGLGLAVSRSIIEQHGGNIEVQSKKGKGTTFIVKLPLNISKNIGMLADDTAQGGEKDERNL